LWRLRRPNMEARVKDQKRFCGKWWPKWPNFSSTIGVRVGRFGKGIQDSGARSQEPEFRSL
jgi:hypothetical protein